MVKLRVVILPSLFLVILTEWRQTLQQIVQNNASATIRQSVLSLFLGSTGVAGPPASGVATGHPHSDLSLFGGLKSRGAIFLHNIIYKSVGKVSRSDTVATQLLLFRRL